MSRLTPGQSLSVMVPGDFLFRPVARLGEAHDEVGDPARRGDHSLDAAGRLGGFDDGVRAERVQLRRKLADEEVLPATSLADAANSADVLGTEAQPSFLAWKSRPWDAAEG